MRGILKITVMFVLVAGLIACTSAEEVVEPETEMSEAEAPPAQTSASAPPAQAAPQPTRPATSQATQQVPPQATQQAAQPAPPAPPMPPPARVFEVPAGTILTFTLIDSLSTETSLPGDTFEASLTDALVVDGETVLAKNALASGRVVAVDEPGRVSGLARIELTMTAVRAGDQTIQIQTAPYVRAAEATKAEDATKIGAGAGIGAAIGAALGGGKGAAIGAAIGGGSGTAVVVATRGDQIDLPSETRVEFELNSTLSITESTAGTS